MPADTGGQAATTQNLAPIVQRSRQLDLGGTFDIPPGDPLSHFGAGFAKVLASNIFLTGLEPSFAAQNVGYFTAPYEHRKHVEAIDVDADTGSVSVRLDNGVTRIAKLFKSQGAIAIPLGADNIFFQPMHVAPNLSPQQTCVWPDHTAHRAPTGIDQEKLHEAVELAFAEEAMTAAYLVTHKGHLIAERYGDGIGIDTPLESWSMGKSLTATLLGILIHQGEYTLTQPAPIPEWRDSGDPRADIRIADILNMSSGLRFRAMQDPDYDPSLGYPDHLYVYTGGINAFFLILSAEDIIDRYTGNGIVTKRRFLNRSSLPDKTCYYDGTEATTIEIDDLLSVTSVTVDLVSGAGIALTQNEDYYLYPLNAENEGVPYTSIQLIQPERRIVRNSRLDHANPYIFDEGQKTIAITGQFGYSVTPPKAIQYAATKIVAAALKESIGNSQLKELKSENLGDYSVTYEKIKDIADRIGALDILEPYKRQSVKPKVGRMVVS